MKKEEVLYFCLLFFHGFLGLGIFIWPVFSKLYALGILVFGAYYIIKSQNKNNEALLVSAYMVSVEVFLRMTDGAPLNEFGKYSIMFFMFLGMYFSGISKSVWIYFLFLLLLVPGILISAMSFDLETDVRKAISFYISGPLCLGISSMYCCQRSITATRLKAVISAFSLPLIALLVYLYLYTPNVKAVIVGTQSNFETSGGFGPNQVSTILGLGIFVFFVQLVFNSQSRFLLLLNTSLVVLFSFRGLVTFSRGGMLTATVMIVGLLLVLYFRANGKLKPKIAALILCSFLLGLGVWGYSSLQTSGLINKRYANEDARGNKKISKLSGREKLMSAEIQMFLEYPLLGVGVGKNKEIRNEVSGIASASHNEITRMLAEHGFLGLLNLLILFSMPLYIWLSNRQNLLALSFFMFWLLTINHAAMRLAAPAFVYALSLLNVYIVDEKNTLYRQ